MGYGCVALSFVALYRERDVQIQINLCVRVFPGLSSHTHPSICNADGTVESCISLSFPHPFGIFLFCFVTVTEQET